jgi:hypothetical protein
MCSEESQRQKRCTAADATGLSDDGDRHTQRIAVGQLRSSCTPNGNSIARANV